MLNVQLALAQLSNMHNIKFTINDLTVDELNFILAALQELPGRVCNPLSQKIREQIEPQLPKTEAPAA